MQQDPEVAALISRPPDPARPYVYPGTNSRINKFGILNPFALDQVTRALSSLRGELLRTQPIPGKYDLAHLQAVHGYLFQDVYPWAGQIRLVDFDKSQDPFTHPDAIVGAAEALFGQLNGEGQLRGLGWESFTSRLTYFLHGLYAIHPFRDGNGRSIRGLFRQLAAECGYRVELGTIPQAQRHATAQSAHRGDMEPLLAAVRRVTTLLDE
jgi:cell filamentation protein